MNHFNHLRRVYAMILIAIGFSNMSFQNPISIPPIEAPFEGVITYQHTVKTKNPMGSTSRSSKFFIKGNMYRSETATNDIRAIEIYSGQDSLFTYSIPNLKCVWFSDVRANKEVVLETKIAENAATVMNISCHILTVKTASMTIHYYFHPDKFKSNAALFQHHQLKHWNTCLEKAKGSLPLKIVYDYPNVTIEMEAVTTETKKLDRWFFKPPYDKRFVKAG